MDQLKKEGEITAEAPSRHEEIRDNQPLDINSEP